MKNLGRSIYRELITCQSYGLSHWLPWIRWGLAKSHSIQKPQTPLFSSSGTSKHCHLTISLSCVFVEALDKQLNLKSSRKASQSASSWVSQFFEPKVWAPNSIRLVRGEPHLVNGSAKDMLFAQQGGFKVCGLGAGDSLLSTCAFLSFRCFSRWSGMQSIHKLPFRWMFSRSTCDAWSESVTCLWAPLMRRCIRGSNRVSRACCIFDLLVTLSQCLL